MKKEMKISIFSNWSKIDILLLVALIVHIFLVSIGFSHTINDIHGFRQTQTALSAFYFLKDGFQIFYETPVLGFPWKIPFEFPLYQGVVALLASTGISLEASGRIISLMFFYLLFPFIYLLKNHLDDFPWKLVCILLLAHPIYIFWSRTFLIESTALYFAFGFFYFALETLFRPIKWYTLFLLIVFTFLGILIKVTTFFVAFFAVCVIVIWKTDWRNLTSFIWNKIVFGMIIGVAFLLQFFWLRSTDLLKSQNIIGKHLTSASLTEWNFGLMSKRLSWGYWQLINIFSGDAIVSCFVLGLLFLFLMKWIKVPKAYILFFIIGMSGPLVFANLYYVHNYYHFANTIYLIIAISFGLMAFKNQLLKSSLVVVLLALFYFDYCKDYVKSQRVNDISGEILGAQVAKYSNPRDVILVFGDDWGSGIPYYSGRRTVCLPSWVMDEFENDPKGFIRKLNTLNINRIVLKNEFSTPVLQPSILKAAHYLGLNHQLYFERSAIRLLLN